MSKSARTTVDQAEKKIAEYVQKRLKVECTERGAASALARKIGFSNAHIANAKNYGSVGPALIAALAKHWGLTRDQLESLALEKDILRVGVQPHPIPVKEPLVAHKPPPSQPVQDYFGQRVMQCMYNQDISFDALDAALGMEPGFSMRMVTKNMDPGDDTIEKLSNVFRVTSKWLVTGLAPLWIHSNEPVPYGGYSGLWVWLTHPTDRAEGGEDHRNLMAFLRSMAPEDLKALDELAALTKGMSTDEKKRLLADVDRVAARFHAEPNIVSVETEQRALRREMEKIEARLAELDRLADEVDGKTTKLRELFRQELARTIAEARQGA